MTEQNTKNIDINLVEMTNLCANVLHQAFLSSPDKNARDLFKSLKQGKPISPGKLRLGEEMQAPLKLALDYSEFKGPGFNFDIFIAALHAMLQRISAQLKAKEKLNILHSETGSFLLNLPGVVERNEQINVLMMAMDFSKPKEVTLSLMFFDPEQFIKPAADA
jgi:hypothetical protein